MKSREKNYTLKKTFFEKKSDFSRFPLISLIYIDFNWFEIQWPAFNFSGY